MALLSADSFNRANNVSLGSTDGAGSLDPRAWVITAGGSFGIDTNRAYATATSAWPVATIDAGTADIDVSITVSVIQHCGVVFRFTDASNYWWWWADFPATNLRLNKVVAGSYILVGSFFTASNGDVLRVVANGNSIACYQNGVLLQTVTDAFNQTATKHGIHIEDPAGRLDNFSMSGLATATTVTGTQATETDSAASGGIPTTRTGTQAFEADSAANGSLTPAGNYPGSQAIETETAAGGLSGVPPFAAVTVGGGRADEIDRALRGNGGGFLFVPPGEDTVSPIAYESPTGVPVPAIWNALMKYYPTRRRGRAVWKLPNFADTDPDAYTFVQPFPLVSEQDIRLGNAHPPNGNGPFDPWSNLLVQTYVTVFYGGHSYVITDDEAIGLTAFLVREGYDPAESVS